MGSEPHVSAKCTSDRLLIRNEIEMSTGRGINLKNLEHGRAEIAERVLHARRNKNDIVFANNMGFPFNRERPLPAFYDIDIVSFRMMMDLATRAAGHETIEMHVDIFGVQR